MAKIGNKSGKTQVVIKVCEVCGVEKVVRPIMKMPKKKIFWACTDCVNVK